MAELDPDAAQSAAGLSVRRRADPAGHAVAGAWPAHRRVVTARVAMGVAFCFCLASLLTLAGEFPTHIPDLDSARHAGLFLFFSARQDLAAGRHARMDEEPAGYQLSSDGLDLLDVDVVERRRRRRRAGRASAATIAEQNRRAQEAVEDARVDDILARLHDSSWDALSPEEIAILQRASQRYRRRRGPADRD